MKKILIIISFIILVACESELPESSKCTFTKFIDNEKVFAANTKGLLYKSYDNGESWKKISISNNSDLIKLEFVNDTIGVIVSKDGSVFRTTDIGESWEKLDIKLNGEPGISINNGYVFIHGEQGNLYFSKDSIFTFEKLDTPQDELIHGAYIDSRDYIWLATTNIYTGKGTVYFTRDNGYYWFPSHESESEIYFVSGLNKTLCAGGNESIFFSNNNGDSWDNTWKLETIIRDSVQSYSSRVAFVDKISRVGETIVAGGIYYGNQPAVLVSRDNGKSWYDAYSSDPESFGGFITSISLLDQLNYRISGNGFTVLSSSNAGYAWSPIDIQAKR